MRVYVVVLGERLRPRRWHLTRRAAERSARRWCRWCARRGLDLVDVRVEALPLIG